MDDFEDNSIFFFSFFFYRFCKNINGEEEVERQRMEIRTRSLFRYSAVLAHTCAHLLSCESVCALQVAIIQIKLCQYRSVSRV